MKKLMLTVAACVAMALGAKAETAYTWSGGAIGTWDNPANWGGEDYPNDVTDAVARFAAQEGIETITVTPGALDGIQAYYPKFESGMPNLVFDLEGKSLTFGAHKQRSHAFPANTTFTFKNGTVTSNLTADKSDGVSFGANTTISLVDGAKVTWKSVPISSSSYIVNVSGGSTWSAQAKHTYYTYTASGVQVTVTGSGSLFDEIANANYVRKNSTFKALSGGNFKITDYVDGGFADCEFLAEGTGSKVELPASYNATCSYNGHTITAKNGGKVYLGGRGNNKYGLGGNGSGLTLTADNGTIATTANQVFNFGTHTTDAGTLKGAPKIVVKGAAPKIDMQCNATIGSATAGLAEPPEVHFILPAEGWATAPFVVASKKTLTVGANAHFFVDASAVSAPESGASVVYPLVTGSMSFADQGAIFASATITVPEDCVGTLLVEGTTLGLKIQNSGGLTVVFPPTIQSKPYTGEPQSADVPEGEGYTVTANEGGTDVGDYTVTLTLASARYQWDGGSSDPTNLTFSITKTDNSWDEEPSLSKTQWAEGEEQATVNAGKPRWGEAVVTYDDGLIEMPVTVGGHTAVFTVEGTDNYSELAKTIAYSISNAEGYGVPDSEATLYIWQNPEGGVWQGYGNWSCEKVPNFGYPASAAYSTARFSYIEGVDSLAVALTNDVAVNTLHVNDYAPVLTLDLGGYRLGYQTFSWEGTNPLVVSNGTWGIPGTLSVPAARQLTLDGVTLPSQAGKKPTLGDGSALTLSGGTAIDVTTGEINGGNGVTLTVDGKGSKLAGRIPFGSSKEKGTTVLVKNGGLLNNRGDAYTQAGENVTVRAEDEGSTAEFLFDNPTYNNFKTVNFTLIAANGAVAKMQSAGAAFNKKDGTYGDFDKGTKFVAENGTVQISEKTSGTGFYFGVHNQNTTCINPTIEVSGGNGQVKAGCKLFFGRNDPIANYATPPQLNVIFPGDGFANVPLFSSKDMEIRDNVKITVDASALSAPYPSETNLYVIARASGTLTVSEAAMANADITPPDNASGRLVKSNGDLCLELVTEGAPATEMPLPTLNPEMMSHTGQSLKPTVVCDTNVCTVTMPEEMVEVGTYTITVSIKEEQKPFWKWADGTREPKELTFTIIEASKEVNSWKVEPALSKTLWYTFAPDNEPGETNAYEAAFGEVLVNLGGASSNELATAAGDYVATFEVLETDDYSGLRVEIPYSIKVHVGPGYPDVKDVTYTWKNGSGEAGSWQDSANWASTLDADICCGFPNSKTYATAEFAPLEDGSPICAVMADDAAIKILNVLSGAPAVALDLGGKTLDIDETYKQFYSTEIGRINTTYSMCVAGNDRFNLVGGTCLTSGGAIWAQGNDIDIVISNATFASTASKTSGSGRILMAIAPDTKAVSGLRYTVTGGAKVSGSDVWLRLADNPERPNELVAEGNGSKIILSSPGGAFGKNVRWYARKGGSLVLGTAHLSISGDGGFVCAEGEGSTAQIAQADYESYNSITAKNQTWAAVDGGALTFEPGGKAFKASGSADVGNRFVASNGTISVSREFGFGIHSNDTDCVSPTIALAGNSPRFSANCAFTFGSDVTELANPPVLELMPAPGGFAEPAICTTKKDDSLTIGSNVVVRVDVSDLKARGAVGARMVLAAVPADGAAELKVDLDQLAANTTFNDEKADWRVTYKLSERDGRKVLSARITSGGFAVIIR